MNVIMLIFKTICVYYKALYNNLFVNFSIIVIHHRKGYLFINQFDTAINKNKNFLYNSKQRHTNNLTGKNIPNYFKSSFLVFALHKNIYVE